MYKSHQPSQNLLTVLYHLQFYEKCCIVLRFFITMSFQGSKIKRKEDYTLFTDPLFTVQFYFFYAVNYAHIVVVLMCPTVISHTLRLYGHCIHAPELQICKLDDGTTDSSNCPSNELCPHKLEGVGCKFGSKAALTVECFAECGNELNYMNSTQFSSCNFSPHELPRCEV